jgi:hypothetical protein
VSGQVGKLAFDVFALGLDRSLGNWHEAQLANGLPKLHRQVLQRGAASQLLDTLPPRMRMI